jgi:hypothetical protein
MAAIDTAQEALPEHSGTSDKEMGMWVVDEIVGCMA